MSSFQLEVKNELYQVEVKNDCCIQCEYSAIRLTSKNRIKTKSASYAERLKFFIKKVHGIDCESINEKDEYVIVFPKYTYELKPMGECCMKAFVRGCYITSGRINDTDKASHLEISFKDDLSFNLCINIFKYYNISVKTTIRNDRKLIYIKNSEYVSDFLTLIGAHKAVCEFENARIIKEIRNNTNRAVNCDNANIQKANDAAYRQIKAIKLLKEKNLLGTLPDRLRETALLRLENPDIDLKELGKLLNPPISKAGTAHRLSKIVDIANNCE